jgi:hypothetical protein
MMCTARRCAGLSASAGQPCPDQSLPACHQQLALLLEPCCAAGAHHTAAAQGPELPGAGNRAHAIAPHPPTCKQGHCTLAACHSCQPPAPPSKPSPLCHVPPACSCYVWRTTALAHAAAQADCASLGGTLAVFATYEEQLASERHFVAQGQWTHLQNFWWVWWPLDSPGTGSMAEVNAGPQRRQQHPGWQEAACASSWHAGAPWRWRRAELQHVAAAVRVLVTACQELETPGVSANCPAWQLLRLPL